MDEFAPVCKFTYMQNNLHMCKFCHENGALDILQKQFDEKKGVCLNATVNNISVISLYRSGELNWWMNPEYPKKVTDMRKSLINFIT